MKCPKCNAAISDSSKFCVHCGAKIEAAERNISETKTAAICINCGAQLKPGAKFCAKCGTAQNAQATQNVPKKAPEKPVNKGKAKEQAAAKKSRLPAVIVSALILVVVIAAGGYFTLVHVFDVDPLEVMKDNGNGDTAPAKEEKGKQKEKEQEEEEDTEKGDPKLLDALDDQLESAKQLLDEASYIEAVKESTDLIYQYVEIAEENDLEEETEEKIDDAFEIVSKAVIAFCKGIEEQGLGRAGYEEVTGQLDTVLELADFLAEKGYKVDDDEITEYSGGTVQRFKDTFIALINEITEREQWSRDEAWTYAEQAYSIQKNGKAVLFDESDLDDPLRLRYVYCLAWITRKRCENGVADGSMTKEDAFSAMTAILPETDYNLLALQDAITYGNAAGKDISGYQAAYNAIIQEIKEEQNLSIVNSGVNSSTTVDVRKFWYFNDLDGDDAYKVDINNGTTQKTRDWIRNNIPSYIG